MNMRKSRLFVRLVLFMSLFGLLMPSYAFADAGQVYWIDVRSAGEFAGEHHPNAVNIPHTEISHRISEVTSDKNAEIHVYCRSGRRSGMAKKSLEALGYTNVTNEGGVNSVLEQLRLKTQSASQK